MRSGLHRACPRCFCTRAATHEFSGIYAIKAIELPHFVAEAADDVPPIVPYTTMIDPIKLHGFIMSLERGRERYLLPMLKKGSVPTHTDFYTNNP